MTVFNNSSFMDVDDCFRLYFLAHVQRLGPKYEGVNPYLNDRFEGVLWHAIMAQHYGSIYKDDETGHVYTVEEIIDQTYAAPLELTEYEEEAQAIRDRKVWWNEMYLAYRRQWDDKDSDWEILGVEESLLASADDACWNCLTVFPSEIRSGAEPKEFCECGVSIDYYAAQLDLRIREAGVEKIVDHKSKKRTPSEVYIDGFSESTQFTHYTYVASRHFDRDIHSGIANITTKLKLVDKRGQPFKRNEEITRGPEDFKQWAAERAALRADIRHRKSEFTRSRAPHHWPRNTGACRKWNRTCDFYGFCWPSRPDWFRPPFDLEDSFEEKEVMHLDNYAKLLLGG